MNIKKPGTIMGLVFLLLLAFVMPVNGGEDVSRISAEELKGMLSSSDLVLLDARTDKDWKKSDSKIVGAVRIDPKNVGSWADNYGKDQRIIIYCA